MKATIQYPIMDAWGRSRTPYAVRCLGPYDIANADHGLVYLTEDEYARQMCAPGKGWRCPICRYDAVWDDDNFEQMVEPDRAAEQAPLPPSLLPCPFCGGDPAWGEGEQKTKYGNEQVYCSTCYAVTPPEGTKAEAARNWNWRIGDEHERYILLSAHQEEVAGLRASATTLRDALAKAEPIVAHYGNLMTSSANREHYKVIADECRAALRASKGGEDG